MSRSSAMTVGFLLLFTGFQLNLVESYILTPRASKFWNERLVNQNGLVQTVFDDGYSTYENPLKALTAQTSPFSNNAYQPQQPSGSYAPNNTYSNAYGGSPYQNANFGNSFRTPSQSAYVNPNVLATGAPGLSYPLKRITPPQWFCWPAICLGAVMFLYGAAFRRH